MKLPSRRCCAAFAAGLCHLWSVPDARAQSARPVAPACDCGPSAMPAYRVPYPQAAYRSLDGSLRSGVTFKHDNVYHAPRTNLGTSAFPAIVGPANWDGLYVGLHGGTGFGTTRLDHPQFGDIDTRGAVSGLHLGRNWQFGSFVLGLEGDASKSWVNGRNAFTSGAISDVSRNWTGSARGRFGYAYGNIMAYGTAGVVTGRQTITATQGTATWRTSNGQVGLAYGAGLAWQATPQISLRGEVLRHQFGEQTFSLGGTQTPVDLDETIVRGGLTFRFN